MDIYKVTYNGLNEYSTPSATAIPTGKTYPLNALVNTIKKQINVAGVMEFLQLENNNWIPLLWNGKVRAIFVQHVNDDVPPPPPPAVEVVHTINTDSVGRISLDGLPYE